MGWDGWWVWHINCMLFGKLLESGLEGEENDLTEMEM